jgi:hypothetical protein
MSFLFKFIDSGFLLTLGLILLISGGIMLYCYRRLNLLEKSVIEHGKILQNFIINYNVQMQRLCLANTSVDINKNNDSITENNTTEYVEFDKIKKINLGEKISVSDEDDSEDEDEDEGEGTEDTEDEGTEGTEDTEDEDEDEDEDEEDEDGDTEDEDTKISENLTISNNKLEDLEDLGEIEDMEEKLVSLENIKLDDQTISNIDDETFLRNLPINLDSFTLETNDNPRIINLENIENSNSDTKVGERKNYSKMKVDDLKTLVVTKNLTDNETSQKMKKSDLVKLLQNQ